MHGDDIQLKDFQLKHDDDIQLMMIKIADVKVGPKLSAFWSRQLSLQRLQQQDHHEFHEDDYEDYDDDDDD